MTTTPLYDDAEPVDDPDRAAEMEIPDDAPEPRSDPDPYPGDGRQDDGGA